MFINKYPQTENDILQSMGITDTADQELIESAGGSAIALNNSFLQGFIVGLLNDPKDIARLTEDDIALLSMYAIYKTGYVRGTKERKLEIENSFTSWLSNYRQNIQH